MEGTHRNQENITTKSLERKIDTEKKERKPRVDLQNYFLLT